MVMTSDVNAHKSRDACASEAGEYVNLNLTSLTSFLISSTILSNVSGLGKPNVHELENSKCFPKVPMSSEARLLDLNFNSKIGMDVE